MSSFIAFRALVAAGLVGTAAAATPARATPSSTVPASVAQAIARQFPGMAYVPGRLAAGYRYLGWTHARTSKDFGYVIDVGKRNSAGAVVDQLAFDVRRRACPSAPSWPAMGTVHINGRAIRWSKTNTATYAWLCLESGARSFVIFGENGSVRTDADLVAYAKPAAER